MSNLVDYKKYMLIQDNITNFFPHREEQNLKSNINQDIKKNVKNREYTKNKQINNHDQLFWAFYIILNGEQVYEFNHSFQIEKEFKIKSIEELRKIKPQLKALKLKINEIEDELLNAKKITVKSLVALCLLYKKNLFYVWNRKYYEFITDANEPINIILWNSVNNNCSHIIDDEKYKYYSENYWCIQNIDKPFKSITGYTRDELVEIVKKLDILPNSKETKKGLYEKILQKL
tara:strand:- start:13028 stop:13723 length:696 start_codon:yes stop_codon:yes gene_type:complete